MRRTALATLLLVMLAPGRAFADGPYEGQWREGPMRIQVAVESWGGDCGPRPTSTSTQGGGAFRIAQSGDQLTFQLRRQRSTRSCWSENRAVRRVSSSYQAGTWRIVCRTPAADSRGETGTYTIQAIGDDRLQFRDVSRYDWQLNTSRCQATITTSQSFSRIGGASSTSPSPTPEPATPRCTPGEAARVVLRPSTAEVPLGGEQCFTARVVDAEGCTVRQRARVRLAEGDGQLEGLCYQATQTAGRARIVATAGALTDTSQVTVRSMDLSDLLARRAETGSVGSGTPEAGDAESQTAAQVSAVPIEEGFGLFWPLVALGAALALVLLAVLLLRRKSTIPVAAARTGEPAKEADPNPTDAPPPEAADAPAAIAPADEPSGEDHICPTCRRGYPASASTCPHDDTPLVAYSVFLEGQEASEPPRVCPTCGEKYPATVTFCGKDGATLVASDSADS
ncbi:MAG: hypothetical protein AB8I08_05095 [Sandaracinaceae bacterium]